MRLIKKAAKFSLLGCLALALYGIATTSGAGWMYVISASLAGVLAVSILSTFVGTRGLEIKRHSPPVGTAGDPLPCALEIRNTGKLSKTLLEIEDDFAGGTGRTVVARAKRGTSEQVEYMIENPRRGIYSDGATRIESSAPFGLLASRKILRAASATTIYPKTFEVAALPRPDSPDAAESGRDEAASPRRGAGGEFWGVREYRPGDPARLIAWRQSARTVHAGSLAVMEMARETDPPFAIALDLDEMAPRAAREMAVSAAASLLLRALLEGREIAAGAGPRNAPFPESPDRDSVLEWCAALESTGSGEARRSGSAAFGSAAFGSAAFGSAALREWGVGEIRRSGGVSAAEASVESGESPASRGTEASEASESGTPSTSDLPTPDVRSEAAPKEGEQKQPPPSIEAIPSAARIRPAEDPVESGESQSGGSRGNATRDSRPTIRAPFPPLPGNEATPTVGILPSLTHIGAGDRRAGTVILVSCHEFAGPGPWMSPEEERSFMDEAEASGRRVFRLGPDFCEPWDIS